MYLRKFWAAYPGMMMKPQKEFRKRTRDWTPAQAGQGSAGSELQGWGLVDHNIHNMYINKCSKRLIVLLDKPVIFLGIITSLYKAIRSK